jgi:hypothetical protein
VLDVRLLLLRGLGDTRRVLRLGPSHSRRRIL